jgi:hypothetical protein
MEKCDIVIWTGFIRVRIWVSGGLFEHHNEPSVFIKCWEIFE